MTNAKNNDVNKMIHVDIGYSGDHCVATELRNGILTKRFGLPMEKITCAACGSPNVTGHFSGGAWEISCPDCGVFMRRTDIPEKTDLENEVDILNSYEKLRYQVNKSKEV